MPSSRSKAPPASAACAAPRGWAEDRQVYFVIEFSRAITTIAVSIDGKESTAAAGSEFTGKNIKAIFGHAAGSEPLIARVGISCTGVDGASKNLAAEIPGWDFDAVAHASAQEWSKALSVLDADLPTKALAEAFYSDAYHGLVAPATFNDHDGTYHRSQDHQNHANASFTKYTALSIWDIYRGEFPFIHPHAAPAYGRHCSPL